MAAFFVSVPHPGVDLERQGPRPGKRRLRVEKTGGRIVDYASGALVGICDVSGVADALARKHLGARVEVGPLLNDDTCAGAAVFIATHEHRSIAVIGDVALLGLVGLADCGWNQKSQGPDNGKRSSGKFQFHRVLDLGLQYCKRTLAKFCFTQQARRPVCGCKLLISSRRPASQRRANSAEVPHSGSWLII